MTKHKGNKAKMLDPMIAEFMDIHEKMEARGDSPSLEDGVMALARLLENVGDDVSARHVTELKRIGAIMWRTLILEFSRESISESTDQSHSGSSTQKTRKKKSTGMTAPFRGCNCHTDTTKPCCVN